MIDTDQTRKLGQRLMDGDDTAFAELHDLVRPHAMGLCSYYLHNHADAEDACQAAMLKFWRNRRALASVETMSRWITSIVRHTAFDFVRRNRKRRPETGCQEILSWPGCEATPLAALCGQETLAAIDNALAGLKDPYYTAVQCHVGEMSYGDEAIALGVPMGTIKSRLHAARKILKHKLEGSLH